MSAIARCAIVALTAEDRPWVRETMAKRWGGEIVVVHDTVYRPAELPGFTAVRDGERVGLVTYRLGDGECEIVTLDAFERRGLIGTRLLDVVIHAAHAEACQRVWLITTNDNLDALAFYQKRGFRIVAVGVGAVDRARVLKPEIPLAGRNGIPLRDELELEYRL